MPNDSAGLEPSDPYNSAKWGRWLILAQIVPGIIGIFIGCVALYAALNEADAVRKQQQAAVWPYVELRDLRFGGTEKYAFTLSFTNKGIGPASIEFFDIKIDGERPNDLADLIRKSADIPDRPFGISNNFARVLSPGEKVDLVEVTTEVVSELYRANEDIDIEAETAFYRQLVDGFTDAYRSGRIELTYC
ncbi:MAG: hypothetical protein AAGK23_10020, partial [Pseudomonadota bacterium]